ncbi:CoA-binding protein [Candidimonas sp. SYP-B2681]|uniref:acetate--CoA ligase family protein n=1 Tax=Candidimonas sp. SYP-B2681 TaxID=2497686 RepID=UPI000F867749|nr:acetate--CoA ligase family protein [Candidimonas sp. SYP-B2681]RTZ45485.1 CoA-binding protein [Candidimonas sp. SYP-B2681]
MNKFKYLLEPRSIAVVGVSDEPGRPGSQAVRALLKYGYAGRIFPVNPKYAEFEGMTCYPSVEAINEPIDLVIIGVPAKGVVSVMEMCAAKSVSYVVVLSGGFRESGPEGVERERQLLEIARKSGIRLIGPNCLGFASIHSNVYAAFGSITREPRLTPGSVSLVTQSGGFGYSIALSCAEAGVGFRHVIATGNETDVDTVEFIDSLIDDERTSCIVAYIEGTRDGRRLLEVGRRALAAGKPILLWKGGITEQGARAAESHTASMTGTYDFYKAMYKQTGIVEISELHEVVDYVKALAPGKYPQSNGVAVMGVSGGSAIVFADAGEPRGLSLCELTEVTQQRLAPVVPNIGAIHNPIDLTAGYFSEQNKEKLEVALRAVLEDENVGSLCVNLATTGAAGSAVAAEVIGRVSRDYPKPVVIFSSTPAASNSEALAVFAADKVPVLPSPSRAANAIAMLLKYRTTRECHLDQSNNRLDELGGRAYQLPSILQAGNVLSEAESKDVLADVGVPITKDILLNIGEMPNFFGLTFPLVVKIVSRDIPHKSEIGGVKVGLRTAEAVEAAIKEVTSNARRLAPKATLDGVLVSEMVSGGYELIAGVVNDEVFGPVVMVGAGGIYAEILKDVTFRLAPFDVRTATEMLDELKCRPIFDGARGGAVLDVNSAARALASLSQFAWASRDVVQEIDINPMFLSAMGVIAADALVVPKSLVKAEQAPCPRPDSEAALAEN